MSTQPVTSSTTNRVVLDYTSRDYKAIRSMLVGLAKGFMPEWTTVGETGDFGTLLLELYAYAGDINNYYIDRIASEAFLGTAIRRQSIMYIADMLGYIPIGQRSATVPLSFTWNFTDNTINTSEYNVRSAKVVNGVVTMVVYNSTYSVSLVAGQTITVSNTGDPYDGVVNIDTVTSDTLTNDVTITYFITSLGTYSDATITSDSKIKTGNIIIIPSGTFITTAPDTNGNVTVFELNFDIVLDSANGKISPNNTSVDNPIKTVSRLGAASEGVTITPTLAGVSKGIPNAEFVLANEGVIDRTVSVYTKEGGNVVQWSNIDKLSLATPTQSAFTSYVDDNNYTHILFGDNASGRIPPTNVEIYVSYRYGVGKSANAIGLNKVTVLNNDFATQNNVTVTNTASPAGGADIESTESIRHSVPRAASLKQRAVSIDDYVNLALQVPGITKATAYGTNYSTVYVRIASNSESSGYVTSSIGIKYVHNKVATISIADSLTLTEGQTAYIINSGTTEIDGTQKITRVFYEGSPVALTHKSLDNLSSTAYVYVDSVGSFQVGQPIEVSITGDTVFSGKHIITSITSASPNGYAIGFTKAHADVTLTTETGTVKNIPGLSYAITSLSLGEVSETPVSSGTVQVTTPDIQSLINALESYLYDKKMIGSVVYGEPVEWTEIDLQVEVNVQPLYNRTNVQSAVKEAIKKVFAYENVDFGKRISVGEVYRAALSVEGVYYLTIGTMKIYGDSGSVKDIETPKYNLPRIKPSIITADTWVTAKGGLANT